MITSSNAEAASVIAFGYGGMAFVMGQLAVDWTALIDSSANLSFSKTCLGGGTATGTLADRDGDHRASTGDQITITLAGCYVKELDDTVDGQMMVALTAPAATQQRAGVLTFSGFKMRASTPVQEITGALRFDYSAGRLSKLVHVYSDAQPFGMTFSDGSKSLSDTVTALDVQHETRVDTVRATTSMRFHLASNLLGGSLEVTTATPWSALFDTYPDAGELSVVGANNGKASLAARDGQTSSLNVVLGGAVIANPSADGIDVLWTGAPWLPQVASSDHYTTQVVAANHFRQLLQPDPAQVLPNGPLVWVYSQPLDPLSVTSASFYQGNTVTSGTVSLEGGLLTVKPSTQLTPGASFSLVLSGSYMPFLRDKAGETLSLPNFFAGTVTQTVSASVVATTPALLLGSGATLVLDASGSSANGAPVASTHWRQLSGPQLSFSDTNAPRVTVSPAVSQNGIAVVELETASAAGDIDRKQISLTVEPDLSQSFVIAYRNGAAPVTIASNADPANSSSYVKVWPSNNSLDILMSPLRFLVALNGVQWQSGLTLTYGSGSTNGVIGPGLTGCPGSANTGSFSILDYALDADGNLARLAMDFDDTCGGAVTQGSVRYHSALPIRQ